MHRFLQHGLWLGILLAAAGCTEESAGTAPGNVLPNGDLIATIVRVVTPDDPFYTVAFPPDPDSGGVEQGVWMEDAGGDDYGDTSRFALVGSAFFVSPDSGAQVELLVQVGTASAGASVRVVVDQIRGNLGIFGLKAKEVHLTVDVYRLR
ncbi:hypothetical protein K8I85_19665 [bacterium]|nr:hypothetical protein [bacterium]